MPSITGNEHNSQAAADSERGTDEREELEETTRFAAVDSDWSAKVLREATNLLMAGKSREVARLCHQVIEREPQNIAAYELLAMAEEEDGNLHLALQAYEQVVTLDPERKADEEKVLALRERLAEEQTEPEDEQDRRLRLFNRWATVALVASLLLLLGVVTAVFALRVHSTRLGPVSQEQVFAAHVARGKQLMTAGRYDDAMAAFREADQIKPGEAGAKKLYSDAYQEYCAAWIRDYRSLGGKLSLEHRENPFGPTRVGPRETGASDSLATGYGAGRFVPAPPDTRVVELPQPLTDDIGGLFDFLPDVAPEPVESGTAPPTNPNASGQPPLPSQGHDQPTTSRIDIWVDQPAGGSASHQSAGALRSEADALRRQDNYKEAIAKYQAAEQLYNQEIEQNPSAKAAHQAAMKSIRQSIKACEERIGG